MTFWDWADKHPWMFCGVATVAMSALSMICDVAKRFAKKDRTP